MLQLSIEPLLAILIRTAVLILAVARCVPKFTPRLACLALPDALTAVHLGTTIKILGFRMPSPVLRLHRDAPSAAGIKLQSEAHIHHVHFIVQMKSGLPPELV